jgi:small-conductance mechanosensitive channel
MKMMSKKQKIILDILNNDRNVLSQPAFSVNVTALADFSVNLTVRWWVDTTKLISASISKFKQVKQAFNEMELIFLTQFRN